MIFRDKIKKLINDENIPLDSPQILDLVNKSNNLDELFKDNKRSDFSGLEK